MWQSFGFNIRKLSQMKANLKINWQAFRQKFYVALCVCVPCKLYILVHEYFIKIST